MTARSSIYCVALAGALAVAAFPANAADLSGSSYKDAPYASVNWTGFYVGANGGYAFDAQAKHGGILDDGGFGGGQIGYNRQGAFGLGSHFVLGLETDFEGAGIDNSGSTIITWQVGGPDNAEHRRQIDYLGTVRGRLGYASGPTLVYATGGFAYGDVKNSFNDAGTAHPGVYKDDGTKTGYAVGGGLEYKFTRNWSAKAEYQYIQLGSDYATNGTGNYIRSKDTELNTFRGGINYHFNSPLESLK